MPTHTACLASISHGWDVTRRPTRKSKEPCAWIRSRALSMHMRDGFISTVAVMTRPSSNYREPLSQILNRVLLGGSLGGHSHASLYTSPPSHLFESRVKFGRALPLSLGWASLRHSWIPGRGP